MRRAALGCLATIAVADYVILRRRLRWIVLGLFDHPAHLATAGLVLVNLPERSPRWTLGFLAGSLFPDVDHLPLLLRRPLPSPDDPRPVTHCLLAAAPVAAVARLRGSELASGLTAGMLAHFLRDLGVGTGAPLAWPASRRSVRLPYVAYAVACLVLAGRAAYSSSSSQSPERSQ